MQPSPSLAHNILSRCCRCGSWTKSLWATRPQDLVMLGWSTAQPAGAFSVLLLCFPPAMSCWTVWPWKVFNIIVFSMVDTLLRDTNERGYSGFLGWLLYQWKEQCDCLLPVCQWYGLSRLQDLHHTASPERWKPLKAHRYVAQHLGRGRGVNLCVWHQMWYLGHLIHRDIAHLNLWMNIFHFHHLTCEIYR